MLTRSICYGTLWKALTLSCRYCMRITLSTTSHASEESLILCGRLNRLISTKKKSKTMHIHVDNLGSFFFSDDLSKIKCTATNTTLNITWQAVEKNVFKSGIQGYRLTVSRILNETEIIKPKNLIHSSNHCFLKDLGRAICLL